METGAALVSAGSCDNARLQILGEKTNFMTDTSPEIRTFLDSTGTPYEVMACDPALADTHDFCNHYQIPFANSANAILIKSRKGEPQYTLCVLLATHRLDVNHCVRKKLGVRKVSFASVEETREITSMEIGGVTPIGIASKLPLWVDESVMEREYIILGGGNRSTKLKVSPQVLRLLPSVEVVSGLANLIPDNK